MFAPRALAALTLLALTGGCATYETEVAALPAGGTGEVRHLPGEVLDESTTILCRQREGTEVCGSAGYWHRDARRLSGAEIAARREANLASTPLPPTFMRNGI